MLRNTSIVSTALFALVANSAAFAADGVFQISQTCASFGCFTGDSGGLPVTITQPGSYLLTSNVTANTAEEIVITVSADDVTINLNGFAILGPITCGGSPTACSAQSSSVNTGTGVRASGVERLTVHNGRVVGVGGYGIHVPGANSAAVYDVTLAENGRGGLVIQRGIVHDVVSELNGGAGISTTFGTVHVRDSVVRGNLGFGLGAGGYCSGLVSENNTSGTNCIALGPNQCETPTSCD